MPNADQAPGAAPASAGQGAASPEGRPAPPDVPSVPAVEAPAVEALPVETIAAEAERIVGLAIGERLRVRLMGGLAIRIQSQSVRRPPFARLYRDFDLVAHGKDVGALRKLLDREGYVGDKLFNAIHGATRLVYGSPTGAWSVDVVINQLAMSHTLDLQDRLDPDGPTLDLADLLLTKLQIWETNRKDLADALCLLADHPLASIGKPVSGPALNGSAGPIDLIRIRSVLGADWGFCHTVERNLRAVADLWRSAPIETAAYPVDRQVDTVLAAIESAPKSLGWKARSRVGERVRWYETPEEAKRS